MENTIEQSVNENEKGNSNGGKEAISAVGRKIDEVLMNSHIYNELSSKEQLELIKFLENKFPGMTKHLEFEND